MYKTSILKGFIVICLLIISLQNYLMAKDYQITEIAKDLEFPWSLAFLPDKNMLITEREGNLRIIKDGNLLTQPISGLPEIHVKGQGGLFDVLVDPDFNSNQRIYLSFVTGSRSKNALSVISARLNGMALEDIKTLLTVSPFKDTPHHFGGRMAMLPDKTILITSGEGFDYREQAQDLGSMLGKILRINTDGSIPQDNPFVDHKNALPEIYSYGHRNAQGILISQSGKSGLQGAISQ